MSDLLSARNPQVKFYLVATWSRADMTYSANSPWYGKSIYQMGKDVQAGYELAAKGAPGVAGIVPVGLAWNAAIETGLADDNPYDDTGASKLNLWAYDSYHASSFGYYLEALMVFGQVTGHDPMSLGTTDHVAKDLGFSPRQAQALQKLAHDILTARGAVFAAAK